LERSSAVEEVLWVPRLFRAQNKNGSLARTILLIIGAQKSPQTSQLMPYKIRRYHMGNKQLLLSLLLKLESLRLSNYGVGVNYFSRSVLRPFAQSRLSSKEAVALI
jgi:hypothetical protein